MSTTSASTKDLTIPLLLGHLVDCVFHGMLLVQVYLYFVSFPQDKKKYKALVLVLLMLENMQTGLVMFDAISAFAEGFGDTADLENIRMQWLSVPVLSALISCPVQFFYAYRVRILSQSKVKAGLLIFLSAAQGIASLAGGIPQARLHGKVTDLEGKRFSPVVIWLAMTCLCDVSIAASMLYYLRTRDTELKSTQILIQRVKKVVLETGALTAGIAVMTLILWVAFPTHTYWATPASIITKVYSNSLLASLNSRMGLKKRLEGRGVGGRGGDRGGGRGGGGGGGGRRGLGGGWRIGKGDLEAGGGGRGRVGPLGKGRERGRERAGSESAMIDDEPYVSSSYDASSSSGGGGGGWTYGYGSGGYGYGYGSSGHSRGYSLGQGQSCSYGSGGLGPGSGTVLRAFGAGVRDRERGGGEEDYGGLGGRWVVSPISGKWREESIRLEEEDVEKEEEEEEREEEKGKEVSGVGVGVGVGKVESERTENSRFSWIDLSQISQLASVDLGRGGTGVDVEGEEERGSQGHDHGERQRQGEHYIVDFGSDDLGSMTRTGTSRGGSAGDRVRVPLRVRTAPSSVVGDLERSRWSS